MRVGQNPAKAIDQVPQPARVTVAVVCYIPFLSGYYSGSLDVLQACLQSIWENTPQPYDLLVFDNASCPEVREYLTRLHTDGRIQYLILSDKNIGKGGAWNMIFQGAPGEIIAYADSDVQFCPGWLERSLEIIETYPNVGMVTACPLRTPEKFYSSTLDWARQETLATLEQGQFMSWEVFKEHNDSLGVEEVTAAQWFDESHDWRMEYRGIVAYAGAAHFQFTSPKRALSPVFPLQMDRPMGQVRLLDQILNEGGCLRLNTPEVLVRHLGNRLIGAGVATPAQKASKTRTKGFWDLPPVRRALMWLYNQVFKLYYK